MNEQNVIKQDNNQQHEATELQPQSNSKTNKQHNCILIYNDILSNLIKNKKQNSLKTTQNSI